MKYFHRTVSLSLSTSIICVGLFFGMTNYSLAQTTAVSVATSYQTQLQLLQSLLVGLQAQLAVLQKNNSGLSVLPETAVFGLTSSTAERNVRTVFYAQAYTCILGRSASSSALDALSDLSGRSFAEVYQSFFFSDEYLKMNVTNEKYVEQLYNCVLGRKSDRPGHADWLALLTTGQKNRQQLLTGFLTSKEFVQLVMPKLSPELRFSTAPVLVASSSSATALNRIAFVDALYRCALKRPPESAGLTTWLKLSTVTTLEKLYTNIFTSPEYEKISVNRGFVVTAYACIMGEKIPAAERARLLTFIEQGGTHAGVISQIVASDTFLKGKGKTVAAQTGFSLELSFPNPKSAWPAWVSLIKPFTAGIPSKDTYPGTPSSCANVSVYAGSPLLGDFLISRERQNGCEGQWKLVGVKPTWSEKSVEFKKVSDVFNPGPKGVTIGDGTLILAAYDPTAMDVDGKTWIAFECFGPAIGVSACMGPLTKDKTLDTAQTVVIINASTTLRADTHIHSASVPKLLSFKGKQYLYWTDVRRRLTPGIPWTTDYTDAGTNLTTKGIEIAYNKTTKRFYPVSSNGSQITRVFTPNDPQSVIVADIVAGNKRSNRVADVGTVATDGPYIYAVLAEGGGDCLTPLSPAEGCYRNTVGRTTNPLAYNTFRTSVIPEEFMPPIYQAYPRFVYRTDTKSTWMIGGQFVNPLAIPNQPRGKWAFPWPENILAPK